MAEVKKIIKKSVSSKIDSDFSPSETSSSLIEGEVYDASQAAKELVQKAEKQAEEILARAMGERDRIISEAKEQGYQEGLAEATEWIVKSREFFTRSTESGKNDLKMLAIKIAEKIVGRGLELQPELINDIVSQAIRTLRQQKNVTIKCNEEDLETLKKKEKEFLEQLGQNGVISFQPDAKIQKGGCIVESEVGVVDARLDTQLKKLQKLLLTK